MQYNPVLDVLYHAIEKWMAVVSENKIREKYETDRVTWLSESNKTINYTIFGRSSSNHLLSAAPTCIRIDAIETQIWPHAPEGMIRRSRESHGTVRSGRSREHLQNFKLTWRHQYSKTASVHKPWKIVQDSQHAERKRRRWNCNL